MKIKDTQKLRIFGATKSLKDFVGFQTFQLQEIGVGVEI